MTGVLHDAGLIVLVMSVLHLIDHRRTPSFQEFAWYAWVSYLCACVLDLIRWVW